jgi:dihydroneopterin aldolase
MASSNPSTTAQSPASIAIDRLQYPSSIIASNVWGLKKEQPAYFNIHLNLQREFKTAASSDALDDSTIHYGELAKRIRAACTPGLGPLDALSKAEEVIIAMGTKPKDRFIIADAHIDLCLSKASMYGKLLHLSRCLEFNDSGDATDSRILFELRDLRLMSLIGVNDYERTGKQPIDATLAVNISGWGVDMEESVTLQELAYLFTMERSLADIVQESSFETLESLGDFVAKQFISELHHQFYSDSAEIRLRLEKPKAIPFADAAVVEIRKSTREAKQVAVSETQAAKSRSEKKLTIIKPYT